MSLVAYESSDESEEEICEKSKVLSVASKSLDKKRTRAPVKIVIPSLTEFKDEIEELPVKKAKFQTSKTGSQLFNLLPRPQNENTYSKPGFTPNVLSSKKVKTSSSVLKLCEPTKSETVLSSSSKQGSPEFTVYNDEKSVENTDISRNDFFSLEYVSNKTQEPLVNLQNENLSKIKTLENESSELELHSSMSASFYSSDKLSVSNVSQQNVFEHPHLSSHAFQMDTIQTECSSYLENSAECFKGVVPSSETPVVEETLLKDKEFMKLQGRRREFEAVNIIDVNGADQLTNKNEWLMKSLTEESTYRPSKKKYSMPTQLQKRKHQITYLAFQAKEREMDLKNQWAMNSRTRRETQAKYGF